MIFSVCVCVRACVRSCVRACVRARACCVYVFICWESKNIANVHVRIKCPVFHRSRGTKAMYTSPLLHIT